MTDVSDHSFYAVDTVQIVSAYDQLRPFEQTFVDVYCTHINGSLADAAQTALAFKPERNTEFLDSKGRELLSKPLIRAAIAERRREITTELKVKAEKVVSEVAAIAFSNMANYVKLDEFNQPYLDLSKATIAQMAAIQEITIEDDNGKKKTKVKLHPKLAALDMLMKYLGQYAPDRVEISGPNGGAIPVVAVTANMSVEQAAEIYRRSLCG